MKAAPVARGFSVKDIKVKDVMAPMQEYATVSLDATLYDAVIALEKSYQTGDQRTYRHRSVLVIDETGDVKGKLTYVDVLRALEPRYEKVGEIETVSRHGWSPEFLTFISKHFGLWQGSLQGLCAKAAGRKVRDMITEPTHLQYIDMNTSLDEGIHHLIMNKQLSVLVRSGDQVVGVLRLIDVFEKVCEEIKACPV